jgi:uncharacterized membrane protein YfcA
MEDTNKTMIIGYAIGVITLSNSSIERLSSKVMLVLLFALFVYMFDRIDKLIERLKED